MFGEKMTENVKGQELPVWQSPKYEVARAKAVDMIKGGNYGLQAGDFWILMNTYANGTKMMYSGLILSHNGCLKINDKLEDNLKFRPECISLDKEGYGDSIVYTYCSPEQGIYEVGEVSKNNCKNDYPYAMALKRCIDRVILKNCKLSYNGIYSEVEAEEFSQKREENANIPLKNVKNDTNIPSKNVQSTTATLATQVEPVIDQITIDKMKKAIEGKNIPSFVVDDTLSYFGYSKIEEIKQKDFNSICKAFASYKPAESDIF